VIYNKGCCLFIFKMIRTLIEAGIYSNIKNDENTTSLYFQKENKKRRMHYLESNEIIMETENRKN